MADNCLCGHAAHLPARCLARDLYFEPEPEQCLCGIVVNVDPKCPGCGFEVELDGDRCGECACEEDGL